MADGTIDIAERERAEETLRHSEERFRSLVETVNDWVWEINEKAVYTYCSPRVREILGYEPEEILGKTPFDLMPPEEADRIRPFFSDITISRKPFFGLRNVNLHKSGHLVTLETNGVPYYDLAGVFCGYRGIDRDVSERKEVEKALRRLTAIVESTNDFVSWATPDRKIQYINEAGKKLIGWNESERRLDRKIAMVHPKWAFEKIINEGIPTAVEKGFWVDETALLGSDGEEIPVSQAIIAHRSPTGELEYISTIMRDISELKKAEEELRRQQNKLRSLVSELTVAEERQRRHIAADLHDSVGQTLAICKMKLSELRQATRSKSMGGGLDEIRDLIDHVIRDTRIMISELSPAILYELGLRPAIEWLIEGVQKRHAVEIVFKAGELSGPFDEDIRIFIFRILHELVMNVVRHAEAGHIEITVKEAGDHLAFTVEDDGIGFEVSQLGRRDGTVSGFGLFSIKERLDYLGGDFRIDSGSGRGSRVMFKVPLTSNELTKK